MPAKRQTAPDYLLAALSVAEHVRLVREGIVEEFRKIYASDLADAYEAGDRDTSREVHDGLERTYLNGKDYARENSKRTT